MELHDFKIFKNDEGEVISIELDGKKLLGVERVLRNTSYTPKKTDETITIVFGSIKSFEIIND